MPHAIFSLRKSAFALGMALASLSAAAANYYLVVPVQKSAAVPPAITVSLNSYTLPSGTAGLPYAGFNLNSLLTVTGDSAYAGSGATWQVVSGAIPTGLSLSSSGQLTGTPTAAGTGSFELKAAYKTASGQQSYQVVVAELQVVLASTTMPAGMVGAAYNYDFKSLLSVTGDPAYTVDQASFSVASGALPPGLSLSAGGVVSGTPTTKNTAGDSFQVLASYKTKSGQQAYTIVVNGAVVNITALEAGYNSTCAVTTAGGVKCWGRNNYGQLGDGTTTNRSTPVDVVGLTSGVVAVSAGQFHSCAITTAGGLKCWGYNGNGQLGNSGTINQLTPVAVTGLTSGVTQVSAGGMHTCAVATGGVLYCWGHNSSGQLGTNTTTQRTAPSMVTGLSSGVTEVATGLFFTCAVVNGGAKCWGQDSFGQLGNSSGLADALTPSTVSNMFTGVSHISAGDYHACAVVSGGAKCWGRDQDGELGDDTLLANKGTPVSVLGLTSGIAAIAAGGYHTCALTTAGALKCWGADGFGQLGNDTSLAYKATPVDVQGLANGVTAVTAGQNHTCATLSSGVAQCWGHDAYGQLGDDAAMVNQPTPVAVQP